MSGVWRAGEFFFRKIKHRIKARMASNISDQLPGCCKFLQSVNEVDICTDFLIRNGYVDHSLTCKNWDLAHILSDIADGNVLDMGSSDSYILKNIAFKKRAGELYGIDFRAPDVGVPTAHYRIGDLTDTGFAPQSFDYITCLSVVEHGVNFESFAAEVTRLLVPGGRLYVTFDYWEPAVRATEKLYGLQWQPLDAEAVSHLVTTLADNNVFPVDNLNWTIDQPVINENYFSPEAGISYTFGMLVLDKALSNG